MTFLGGEKKAHGAAMGMSKEFAFYHPRQDTASIVFYNVPTKCRMSALDAPTLEIPCALNTRAMPHKSVAMHVLLYALFVLFHRCIGANERIFDHFLSRSSLPTRPVSSSILATACPERRASYVPFSLVPMGSPPLLIRTQALSSNLTTLPSGLWHFLTVRTTTACLMSPRRTLLAALTETPPPPDSGPKFLCFCTTTMMRSPGRGGISWVL